MRMDAPPQKEAIADRLAQVESRIAAAARRIGRDPSDVRLVVITKGHPIAVLEALIECGHRRLGENRVEEALPKIEAVVGRGAVEWHLVGPLQSRKVRLAQDRFALIHAVDRLKVAELLDAQAESLGRRQAVLFECNVSGEATKSGWRIPTEAEAETALEEMRQVAALRNLTVRGLMTVGIQTADLEIQHRVFRRLAVIRARLQEALRLDLPDLSMGMTDDFEAAIEEGATLVRIGRAILGERV